MSDDNIAALSATLANVEALSAELAGEDGLIDDLRGSVARIDAAAEEIGSAAVALRRFADEANEEVGLVGVELQDAINGFERDVGALRVSLVETSDRLETLGAAVEGPAAGLLNDLRRTSQDVQAMVGRFDRIAREIEQNPQGFVFGQSLPVRREGER
jgi:phospholipid/cholesterol/gamma-HCH transport system substrate-binding protein